MEKQVDFVEPNGQDEMDVTAVDPDDSTPGDSAPEDSTPQARPAAKFVYPGGSRPLEGYTIKRGVGHGGFGEIYYATSDAGKEVALKLIRRNFEVELRGIRHCLNLKHPNLLAVYDIRQDERGDKWVVMEYVTGECLEEVIAAQPTGMPVAQALAWIHGIGAGVACLHDHGVVHRDLKPGNLFSDEGIVKIGDYGLSKFISCSRRSGQTESVGTVHYMAPEVANGRYGKEIDVYALGIVLYEMLTGRVPFEGESVGEVLMKHLTAPPDVSMLAEPYRSVVAGALEKDPAKRFGSVSEMLAGLPRPVGAQVHAGPMPSGVPLGSGLGSADSGDAAPTTTMPTVEAVAEEPIWREVRRFCRKSVHAWNESNLNTPTKIILLMLGLIGLLATAQGLIPLALLLLFLYGCYWVVRTIVLSASGPHRPGAVGSQATTPSPPPTAVVTEPEPPAAQTPDPPGQGGRAASPTMPRWARHERASDALVLKTPRERLTELLGSLLASALVAATMCLVMAILNSFRGTMPRPEQAAWLVLISIVGAWAVLVPSKFWEGSRGEAMLRRFIMMAIGLGLGVLAFAAAWALKVDLPYDAKFPQPHNYQLPQSFYANGAPQWMAYMAVFGTMFLAIRWWRLADPLRATRMSLWSMVFCMVLGWLVAGLWLFPQPWLMMAACAISVSVQLASPWMSPRQRHSRRKF